MTSNTSTSQVKEQIAGIEKRSFPRVASSAPVQIGSSIEARLVNVSDSGIAFVASDVLNEGRHAATLNLSAQALNLNIEIRRSSKLATSSEFIYGAKFAELGTAERDALRKHIYASALDAILKDISSDAARKDVLVFAGIFRDYVCSLMEIDRQVKTGESSRADIQKRLNELNNNIVLEGERLKDRLNDKLVFDRVKREFRALVGSWAFKSQIMKRGFDKPKGYPGDYRTLEVIYNYETFSPENDLGFYFDWYFLANPYADAVRNRMGILREIVADALEKSTQPVKFLNLASGSCRELREIVQENNPKVTGKAGLFSLIDWDDDALAFSANALKDAPKGLKFDFIKEDIMNFIKDTSFFAKHGSYDLIYSIGLADYLPDRVLRKLIKNSFDNLNPGGRFIIAHKDKELSFSHLPPEWFCDWVFFPRNEADMFKIVADAGLADIRHEVRRDSTDQIFFISIIKD